MPKIRFIVDTQYFAAKADGGRDLVKIKAGTVQTVSEATAARWERRDVVERLPEHVEVATSFAPPPPPPPAPSVPPAPPMVPEGNAPAPQPSAPAPVAPPMVPETTQRRGRPSQATPPGTEEGNGE